LEFGRWRPFRRPPGPSFTTVSAANSIPHLRLHNQCVTRTRHRRPADVVSWLGAVQAQEFGPAKWALGLRLPETATEAAIDRAFDAGRILRTHVMRPTWHFVAAADIRWMLELTKPHVHRVVSHYCGKLGLDPALRTRAAAIFERALEEQTLTRTELSAHLERGGIAAKGVPLAMLTIHAELEGVICSGARRGKELTYAQLAARASHASTLTRDEALATLTKRYFRSHGPATIRDFVWWSGLKTVDAKRGLEINRAQSVVIEGTTYWTVGDEPGQTFSQATAHLLPVYDEYLVSYRDRQAVPHGPTVVPSQSGGGVRFQHALVIAGQVAGTWRMTRSPERVSIDVTPMKKLTRVDRTELGLTAERYGRFLGMPISLAISS
jgi:DNA glycosylase AlkZ-like